MLCLKTSSPILDVSISSSHFCYCLSVWLVYPQCHVFNQNQRSPRFTDTIYFSQTVGAFDEGVPLDPEQPLVIDLDESTRHEEDEKEDKHADVEEKEDGSQSDKKEDEPHKEVIYLPACVEHKCFSVLDILFASHIFSLVDAFAKAVCYGCEVQHPSQTQHTCMMLEKGEHLEMYFDDMLTDIVNGKGKNQCFFSFLGSVYRFESLQRLSLAEKRHVFKKYTDALMSSEFMKDELKNKCMSLLN